jgi:DNA-binding response OmpR family regulator
MSLDTPRVLIVEDHPATRHFLADNLAADGYEPLEAATAGEGRRRLIEQAPDLAIFDLGLPDRDGLELLGEIRSGTAASGVVDPAIPVLLLSGRSGELDRVRGFERGADDYLVKPFSYPELRARLALLLRRASPARPGRVRVGGLEVDRAARVVRVDGRPVPVSKKEWALLEVLCEDPVRLFTRSELLSRIWGFAGPAPTRTLDSHASRLRRKLSIGGERFVVNVWGAGYRLTEVAPR